MEHKGKVGSDIKCKLVYLQDDDHGQIKQVAVYRSRWRSRFFSWGGIQYFGCTQWFVLLLVQDKWSNLLLVEDSLHHKFWCDKMTEFDYPSSASWAATLVFRVQPWANLALRFSTCPSTQNSSKCGKFWLTAVGYAAKGSGSWFADPTAPFLPRLAGRGCEPSVALFFWVLLQ
jgi:hypothetical protein